MKEIEIEKGIPVAKSVTRCKGNGRVQKLIKRMDIGDSFLLEVEGRKLKYKQRTFSAAAKSLGVKLITRTVDGGLRVWRVG